MKNKYRVEGENVYVECRVKKDITIETIVDKVGLSIMDSFNTTWFVVYTGRKRNRPYVYGSLKSDKVLLHRILMNPEPGEYVDHINGESLDNRFSNLRCVNAKQNAQNRKSYGMSGVRNVVWDKYARKWKTTLKVDEKQILIGSFDLIADAEKAAIEARKKYNYIDS